ncbi:endonuclease/exonuclease/phosphatase family protein [uncultured Cyclobacterium sp.]|uniref:endonuclease/exonuclease/phosphatase family protein n=1 Tax=uncultured Cyclobacterium sp. TaxID=453820 RepID=UPI0030EDDF21|tara:strand:- start:94879 stop:95811 length:933 start_codon:yes stop_codon:yes gene_type:complete
MHKNIFKLLPLLFFCLLSHSLFAQSDTLKVLSYNIWNGFDWGNDLERKQKMTAWLKEVNPDVIGFQELNDFTAEDLKIWANEFGHGYSVLLKEHGYPIGITSKEPIHLKTKMQGGLWHGMLHAETFGIDFIAVHLSPHDWEFRRREAEMICEYAEKAILNTPNKQLMILGDFNSHSPFDWKFDNENPFSLKRNQLSDSLRRVQNGPNAYQTLRDGTIDYSVISRFLSLPLIDTIQKKIAAGEKKTFPTPMVGQDISKSDFEKYRNRIDYILVSSNLESALLEAKILNQGTPDILSDHYPVLASFLHKTAK